ncbi:MAG: hypothetical protein ACOX68_05650 [Candidatus Limivicinus sp.]|jgi:hypothetical protein
MELYENIVTVLLLASALIAFLFSYSGAARAAKNYRAEENGQEKKKIKKQGIKKALLSGALGVMLAAAGLEIKLRTGWLFIVCVVIGAAAYIIALWSGLKQNIQKHGGA